MIHNAPIGLLRKVLVKAAVPRLHMKNRNLQPLRRDRSKGGVGVSQHQKGIGPYLCHQLIAFGYDIAYGFPQILSHCFQIMIRLSQSQILKKNLVQGIVIVLSRMHQNLIKIFVTLFDYFGQPDDLRSGSDHGHHLQLAHSSTFSL